MDKTSTKLYSNKLTHLKQLGFEEFFNYEQILNIMRLKETLLISSSMSQNLEQFYEQYAKQVQKRKDFLKLLLKAKEEFEELPIIVRQILVLKYRYKFDMPTIADKLNVSVRTAYRQLDINNLKDV